MHMHKREEKYEIRSGVPHSTLARNPGRCSQTFTGLIGTQTLMCNFLFSGSVCPGNGTEETRENPRLRVSVNLWIVLRVSVMKILSASQRVVGRVSQMPTTQSIFPHLFAKKRLDLPNELGFMSFTELGKTRTCVVYVSPHCA